MTELTRMAYEEWEEADAQARAAEDEVKQACERHDRHGKAPPGPAAIERARRMRTSSDEKLARVIGLLTARRDERR